jgi:hypothetical protein
MFKSDDYDGNIKDYGDFINAGQLAEAALVLGIDEIGA